MHLDDTIVAVATPPGRGGIGVVRIAGTEAKTIAAPMLRLKRELKPGQAIFGELIEPCGTGALAREQTRMDEVVVNYFARPHSYTTDDIIEISAHGSPVVLERIVQLALAAGARLAEPGEFTMRAFLNGRIDLSQAEAVRDLIESQTLYQAKVAAQQLGGSLSKTLQPIKAKLVELIALLEAGIDFAEDDVSVLPGTRIRQLISELSGPLQELAQSFDYGRVVHEGLTLAIVGRPNVGKSSLFNRLVERERAIVTASPGTTRDLVTETVSIGGIPVKLVDTAGIRSALDEAESIGIRKSKEALADAGLVLVVIDSSQAVSGGLSEEDRELLALAEGRSAIVVLNKSDLAMNHSELQGVRTSAITGHGISELREEILKKIGGRQHESAMLTNVRQQKLVQDSLAGLAAAIKAGENDTPHEMLLLDLYSALHALDEITGATTNDDILNVIFGKFCIGK
ncbi:MAG: tRNA uridine-5-carboxymethylaminomethyl(34) synthesis GTPase MnmE [Acidobacteria bacterium]|nr:MAG: tRNA uridine-5-carboxymethylaminomethyl(34) synthesis GTPase MnmE [Acidobacteriota bacterium]PYV87658.1 MAG: tRNA uridine-5-carboxymethylaminomethyl(34) synthesis GTPase MnmE [Acidobacteriota bacterium]